MIQEFVQEIQNSIQKGLRGIHTAMPGTISSFDAAKGVATVQPAMKFKKPDGKTMDFPQLTGVPVVFPQGASQNVTIAYPVKAGDGCLIVIAEQSIDYWQYGQETKTDLAFDMSNAICIPGLFAKGNASMEEACSQDAVVLNAQGSKVVVKGGEIAITAAKVTINGNVEVNGSIKSTGDTEASGISVAHHTHTGDSGGQTSSPH